MKYTKSLEFLNVAGREAEDLGVLRLCLGNMKQ
jgi:hypothetical protein